MGRFGVWELFPPYFPANRPPIHPTFIFPWNKELKTNKASEATPKTEEMVKRQPSPVTSITLSTAGSDSSNSIANSDQNASDFSNGQHASAYFTPEFVQQVNAVALEENQKLNLNLGLAIDPSMMARRQPIKLLIRLVHHILLIIESPMFRIWSRYVPLRLRQKLTLIGWKIYFPLHKLLIGRRTGLHRDVSLEYHALTTVMWWGRLVSLHLNCNIYGALMLTP